MSDQRTRPAAEDLRFRSNATGEHILDIYLEACEMGGKPLPELLSLVFNELGELDSDNFEFRVNESTRRLQYRFGVFITPEEGWYDVAGGSLLQSRGAWQAGMPYEQTDLVTHNGDVYLCLLKHSGATFNTSLWQRLIQFSHLDTLRQEVATNTAQVANDKASVSTMMNQVATDKTTATTAASQAATSAANASTSETKAKTSETNAKASETAAKTSETNAGNSATNAAASATASANSATTSTTSATNAANSATLASNWASAPQNTQVTAGNYSALHHATNAVSSATAASTSASNASTSASNASTSAAAALTSANNAAASATAASTSAGSANQSVIDSQAARDAAITAKNDTLTIKGQAETAKVDAEAAATRAENAATAAAGGMVDGGSADLSGGVYPAPLQAGGQNVTTLWKVTVGGTVDSETYGVGDTLVYSKTLDSYYKIDNTEAVTSVNGKSGVVSLVAADLPTLQPKDATLTTIAALTPTTDQLIYFTASDTAATTPLTATARTLLDDTSTTAMRTTLGVSAATATAQRASSSATFTTVAGSWYRIASSAVNIVRNSGLFRIHWAVGSESGSARFTCDHNNGVATSIEQIGYVEQGTLGFDAIRVVYHTTATANFAYLEMRASGAMTSCVVSTEVIDPLGWTLAIPSTAGSIPGGYTSTQFDFVPDLTPGTYTKVTTNREGRVTAGSALAATDIPALDWSKITSGKPTTASGYGFTLAASDIPSLDWSKITSGFPTTLAGYGITDALPSSGNAVSASKLATARTITLSGDGTATFTFDGTANATPTFTLATTGVTAGTFTKVTVDAKGRVTAGATLAATDIPALDWSKITTGKPTTLAGYGISGALAEIGAADASHTHSYLPLIGGALTGNVSGLRFVTVGAGNDYASGGVELVGNGATNTVFPTLGFHQPSLFASSIQLRAAGDFRFYAQGAASYASIRANVLYENDVALSTKYAAAGHTHAYMADGGSYGTIYLSNWLRTTGSCGWYSETYGGGWHMQDTTWIRAYNGKKIYVSNTEADSYNTAGGVYASGNGNFNDVYIRSDIRLKTNIEPIKSALAKVKRLTGNLYDKKGQREAGLIAQDVGKVQPESVFVNEDGTLSIAHAGVLALIVEAIKELDDKLEALQ